MTTTRVRILHSGARHVRTHNPCSKYQHTFSNILQVCLSVCRASSLKSIAFISDARLSWSMLATTFLPAPTSFLRCVRLSPLLSLNDDECNAARAPLLANEKATPLLVSCSQLLHQQQNGRYSSLVVRRSSQS
jgi:hypothetical protein